MHGVICVLMWLLLSVKVSCAGHGCPPYFYEYEYGRDKEILRCPWHGWEFGLKGCKHLVEGGVQLRGYEVEVEGSEIYVLI
ncbi:hypothetical protein AB4114_03020 [Paenibacillus sp. 2RAB27]|uniref:Rieske 2Fe-2S domain-containing protein n=1 Tax=Paenibacillus sp. 2RAB27 TaxID=3232991 RepID=UPI003F9ADA43